MDLKVSTLEDRWTFDKAKKLFLSQFLQTKKIHFKLFHLFQVFFKHEMSNW